MPMSEADLAYMRETQAVHRPTPADLAARVTASDGMGGRTVTAGAAVPVMIRLDGNPDEVPVALASRYEGGTILKATLDLIDVHRGDTLTVSATEVYEIISEGDPDRWATAQVVYARRIAFPARA